MYVWMRAKLRDLMVVTGIFFLFCFFKQKTAYEMRISDWSSDVCSSDLVVARSLGERTVLPPTRSCGRRQGGDCARARCPGQGPASPSLRGETPRSARRSCRLQLGRSRYRPGSSDQARWSDGRAKIGRAHV